MCLDEIQPKIRRKKKFNPFVTIVRDEMRVEETGSWGQEKRERERERGLTIIKNETAGSGGGGREGGRGNQMC